MIERTSETLEFGRFSFSTGNGLWRGAVEVPLPPRAVAVLGALVARPGQLVSKAELLDAGWKDAFVTEASLLEAIHVLRAALGDDRKAPCYIQTVHRRGYRFIAPVVARPTAPSSAPREDAVAEPERADSEAAALDTPAAPPAEAVTYPPFFSGPEWRLIVRRCGWAAAATVLTSLLVAAFGPRPIEDATGHFSIALPAPIQVPPAGSSVSASPDGRRFAFVASAEGRSALFLREASQSRPIRIPDADEASDPFFSPDSRFVGYFAGGQLKVAEPGRPAHAIAPAMAGAGAAWLDAGTIVFGGGPGGGLATVSLDGGPPEVLIQPQALSPDVRFGWPDPLPEGQGLLFTVITPSRSDVAILEPGMTRHRVLVHDAAFGRYAPTGHLIVERRGQLAAAPFNLARGSVTGAFRPVVTDVASAGVFDGPRYAFSRSGALVYVPGPAAGPLAVRWRAGNELTASADFDFTQRVYVDQAAGASAGDSVETPGEAGLATIGPPGPGGLEVAFAANKTGPYNLFIRPLSGGGETALDSSPWNQVPTSWSPDGHYLAFTEFHPATGADVWVLDRFTGAKRPLARTPQDETAARYSPDGRWLAYLSKATGDWQVVVVPAGGGAAKARFPAQRVWREAGAGVARQELRIVLAWFAELSQRMRGPA
jgi:DNA-binding winged helix-turn-helix (wHTH) protein